MATTVKYTQKNGTPGQATFPTRALAEKYAATVRNPCLVDSDTKVDATFTKCPEATEEMQKYATNAYFSAVKGSEERYRSNAAELHAEAYAEHFAQARARGVSSADAWSDWDFINGRR